MKFQIETKRLLLRDLLPTDDEGMFQLDSNPDVHRYLGNKPIKSINQAREVISKVRKQYEENGIGRWAAIEKSSGNFIGWAGLKFITEAENNHVRFHDVGYRLHPDYWHKGYATESTVAALQYGFDVLKLQKIIGTCQVENKASRRVLEKCGLKFIEKFVYDIGLDCDWLSITSEEWKVLSQQK
jgi:ribosomal-protein-alanine N-acetyltransferase